MVLPVEDVDVAFGHAEAVDVLQREGCVGPAGTSIPVREALHAPGLDGGVEIRGFDGVDVDRAELVRLLAEDGEGGLVHERR